MDSLQNRTYSFFITDKNYIFPNEYDTIKIQKYFDISKNCLFSFIFHENDLFIILNQNTFGSAFFGNTVIIEPKYFMIKKFNPVFILIQILYSNKIEERYKKIMANDYIDTSAIIQNYIDKLKSLEENSILFNNNFDLIFQSSINFVKIIFEKFSNNLDLISEIKEIQNDLEGGYKICAKKCESKVYDYLNKKVNLSSKEKKEIEESGLKNENEKSILIKRKLFEKISILEPFLPNDIYIGYLKYKHIDFLNNDEITKKSNEDGKNNKRKKTTEKDNKRKKREKKEKEGLTLKEQKTIFDMLKKKD